MTLPPAAAEYIYNAMELHSKLGLLSFQPYEFLPWVQI